MLNDCAILTALRHYRQQLIPLWETRRAQLPEWKQTPLTGPLTADRNMCLFTAGALLPYLQRLSPSARIVGGEVYLPELTTGGFFCAGQGWQGHYWWETDEGDIWDITAQQFGAPTIVHTSRNDPRYQANYTPREIKQHLQRAKTTIRAWQHSLTVC